MFLDMDKVNRLVADGYISVRRHPKLPLRIFNYTPTCQHEWKWTTETIACRGLILDDEDNVVSRPFPKFFTPNQYRDLRCNMKHLFNVRYKDMYKGPFTTTEKMDGSLGILYQYDGFKGVATRGSFTSGQAMRATEMLMKHYGGVNFPAHTTWLFEIIYPGNRIVLDYGDREELVLLTALDNKDQRVRDDFIGHWVGAGHPATPAHHYDSFQDLLDDMERCEDDNREGVVAYFPQTQVRVKVKLDEYLRLHKILTNVTEKSIWQMIRDGKNPTSELAAVPDEFHNWIYETQLEFARGYDAIEREVRDVLELEVPKAEDRKALAAALKGYKHMGIAFAMYDKKDYSDSIWRLLKP